MYLVFRFILGVADATIVILLKIMEPQRTKIEIFDVSTDVNLENRS